MMENGPLEMEINEYVKSNLHTKQITCMDGFSAEGPFHPGGSSRASCCACLISACDIAHKGEGS